MANNYTQFSEGIDRITREERTWIEAQLDVAGWESDSPPGWDAPIEDGFVGFDWEFQGPHDRQAAEGESFFLIYVEESGSPEHVGDFIQAFLAKFRPDECFGLTYSYSCSKPRLGEFGGGGLFVTKEFHATRKPSRGGEVLKPAQGQNGEAGSDGTEPPGGAAPAQEPSPRRRFYRTTYKVVVLSDEEPPLTDDLEEIAYSIDEGPFVGTVELETSEEVTREAMDRMLEQAGSDPLFFGESDDDEARSPRLGELRRRLLADGGDEVVLAGSEFDLGALLGRGRDFPSTMLRLRAMAPSQCHGNAARLARDSRGAIGIATGYALSDDGLWRQHSWCVEDGRIVETTVARVRYFGFILGLEETARFILQNLPELADALSRSGPVSET